MSAFIVSRDEIDILVAAGVQLVSDSARVDREHASQVGQNLLDECVASVRYRYPNDDLNELPGSYDEETIPGSTDTIRLGQWLTPYRYRPPEQPVDREQTADAIGTYEYQSCEHPQWEDSWAHSYCIGLRSQLPNLPEPPAPEQEPALDPDTFRRLYGDLSRDDAIRRIRAALKRRSGKTWSVTGGRGTAWGWITITAPPKRRVGFGYMTEADQQELADLLGKDRVHHQGETIPASNDYRREYIDRALGREPAQYGVQYWD